MKVRLTQDTAVRFVRDTVLEVSDQEASRLFAFNLAVKVEKAEAKPAEPEKKPAKKKSKSAK